MRHQGFTIVELVTVVAIVSILLTIAGVNYGRWNTKVAIEKETHEMLSDFSSLRLRAIHTKLPCRAFLYPSSYEFRTYDSEDDLKNNLPGKVILNKLLPYRIQDLGGNEYNNITFTFDSRGIATDATNTPLNDSSGAIRVKHSTNVLPGVDCITVNNIQTKIGIFENAKCTSN